MKLYLVRHGEAEGSAGRAVGQLDLPLSVQGARNVEALAASWQGPPPDRLFASDLKRAAESARILGRRFGIDPEIGPVIDARLREVSFGDWEGRAWDEIYVSDRERYESWSERWWDQAPPGGESFTDLGARVLAWYREQGEEDSVSVVVAHGGSIRALLVELLAIPRERAFELALSPARVSAVEVEEGRCELLFLDQVQFPSSA